MYFHLPLHCGRRELDDENLTEEDVREVLGEFKGSYALTLLVAHLLYGLLPVVSDSAALALTGGGETDSFAWTTPWPQSSEWLVGPAPQDSLCDLLPDLTPLPALLHPTPELALMR